MPTIYVLYCAENKWYVGRTDNPIPLERVLDHFSNRGSAWTKRYRPLRIDDIHENCDNFDEDKITKMYMAQFNIPNVRGGSYVQIELSVSQIDLLEKEICTAQGRCFQCKQLGHYVTECPLITVQNTSNVTCYRCGQLGHYAPVCRANRDIDGRLL